MIIVSNASREGGLCERRINPFVNVHLLRNPLCIKFADAGAVASFRVRGRVELASKLASFLDEKITHMGLLL